MKAKAIWIDTENAKVALHMVEAEEAVELMPCAFEYLSNGTKPTGKSEKFMEAFELFLTGAELVCEED